MCTITHYVGWLVTKLCPGAVQLHGCVPDEDDKVEEAIFRTGLHCIGKTFNNARHAFLSLSV